MLRPVGHGPGTLTEARVSATAVTALDAIDDAPYAVFERCFSHPTSNIQHPVSGQGGLLLM
jgi:hypothetical protein